MDYKIVKTKNSLPVLTVEMPSLESACLTFWVKSGSRNEVKTLGGISHFLEHMAFKGGEKYKTALAVSEALDGLGAEYNAATSKEWTAFYVKTRATQIEKAYELLSDMLVTPTLDAKEMEKERGVILEEIAMEEDHPSEKVGSIFSELIFPNHPLGADIAGTPDTVKSMQKADFVNYRSIYYVTQNCLLTLSGGITQKLALDFAEKYFGNLKQGIKSEPILFSESQKKPVTKCIKKATEQSHLILGYLSYPTSDSRKYAQTLLSIILGGGMSSRLFTEIREKRGLAYSVGSSVSTHIDTGVFATYAGTDPKNAEEVVKIIISEHEDVFGSKKITAEELQKSKDYLKGRAALSLEDTFAVNSFFAKRAMFLDTIETPEQYFEKIDAVTLNDLEEVAKDLFKPGKINFASIGPKEIKLPS